MAEYQITCATKSGKHSHIVSAGTADGKDWTVKAVRQAIKAGDRFYTVSPSTGAEANVRRYRCPLCQKGTIRSKAGPLDESPIGPRPADNQSRVSCLLTPATRAPAN